MDHSGQNASPMACGSRKPLQPKSHLWGLHWLVFVNMTQTIVIWEEEPSLGKTAPSDWPASMPVWLFFILD